MKLSDFEKMKKTNTGKLSDREVEVYTDFKGNVYRLDRQNMCYRHALIDAHTKVGVMGEWKKIESP